VGGHCEYTQLQISFKNSNGDWGLGPLDPTPGYAHGSKMYVTEYGENQDSIACTVALHLIDYTSYL